MPASLLTVTPLTASGISHVDFNPSIITGLIGWFEANSITGLTSGQSVASWPNNITSGATFLSAATQATAANQPVWISPAANFNNQAAVDFNGTHILRTPTIGAVAQPWTVFVVSSNSSLVDAIVPVAQSADVGWGVFIRSAGTQWKFNAGTDLGSSSNVTTNAATLVYGLSNATQSAIRVNGGSTATGDASVSAFSSLEFGGRGGASLRWFGRVAEFAVFNRALTLTERTLLESYFTTRYAIT